MVIDLPGRRLLSCDRQAVTWGGQEKPRVRRARRSFPVGDSRQNSFFFPAGVTVELLKWEEEKELCCSELNPM